MASWGVVHALRRDATSRIGEDSRPDDLCPACFADLLKWFCARRSPMPAPPKTQITRRGLDRAERLELIASAEAAFREQLTVARDYYRDHVSELIDPDMAAEAIYAGLPQRLNALIGHLSEILKRKRA
jgi:hypothetical protein